MTIRRKVSAIVAVVLLGLVAAIFLTARLLLIDRFAQLEQREVSLNVERAVNALSDDLAALTRSIEDYASWDRTYEFVVTRDPKYVNLEMGNTTLAGLGVSFIGIFDAFGRPVFTKTIDVARKIEIAVPAGLMEQLSLSGPLLRRPGDEKDVAGILLLPQGPMRIGAAPILTGEKKGPMRGTVVMGQWLDETQIGSLAQRTRLNLSLQRVGHPKHGHSGAVDAELAHGAKTVVRPEGPDLVAGYSLLRDLNGVPILVLRVRMPRTIYAEGRVTLVYLIMAIVAAGVVFGAVTNLLLHRLVLSRLERLTRSVADIGVGQHFSARVELPGSDELSMLANSINGTLGSLEQAEEALVRTNAGLEERIRERTAENVENIIRSMDEALIVTDTKLHIRRVNPRTLSLLGYLEEQLIGQPAARIMADLDGSGQTTGVERTFLTRSGQTIPVLFSSAELRNSEGLLEGYVWIGQDVTELKRVQEEVVRACHAAEQANRAKSTFLANMSHELRTPLNAIIGYSQLLQEDCGLAPSELFRPDLKKIERSGYMLLGIVNDVLDLSKIEAGRMELHMEIFSVPDVLHDVRTTVQHLANQRGNRVEVTCGEGVREGYGDVAKFRQSLLNLVNNACKFTENGMVAISAQTVREDRGALLEVQVADSGIGIPEEDLGKLFLPFSQIDASPTRRYGGTGLGLAISRKFCQMMGGDITVESELGRGSRFSLRIPAMDVGGPPEV